MFSGPSSLSNRRKLRAALAGFGAALLMACSTAMPAQTEGGSAMELRAGEAPTYADLVTFALAADTVAIVTVDDAIAFPPERAPDVAPDRVRLYVESLTRNLLAAPSGVGESLIFVAETDREADGDAPDWDERDFVIFADQSRTRPGEVQLVSSRAMFPAGPVIEARVRNVLRQLAAADAPTAITGVRDVISVEGNLAGESETQMFVETASGAPVSLTVLRRPGMPAEWGVSLGEIVDTTARPPERETLAWYRFACSLPRELPSDAFLQGDRTAQQRARQDYAFVLSELGDCERRYS